MNVVNISWYLSGLFLTALIFSLIITAAPNGETFITIVRVIIGICFILFGVAAIYLKKLLKRKTNKKILGSKWFLNLYLGFAIIMTLLVLFAMLG